MHICKYVSQVMESREWNDYAKRLLKSELVKRGISHEELAKRLGEFGIIETKSSIDSKISRGTFSASFLLQCLFVIGCNNIHVEAPFLLAAEPTSEYKIIKNNG